MIFKVLYQEKMEEVPVRESTKSLYIEGINERNVRKKLSERNYNIEYVQVLEGEHLNYEKQSENFKLETV